jgi:FtsP/CotA-like multicopper oxidase with cupredoxin domain
LLSELQVDQAGSYWWHSHQRGQYPDGLRGPLVVHDPEDPFKDQYDEEVVLTLSDWYHERMQELLKGFVSISNPSGAEPVPQAALMNDTQNIEFKVQPGKTYLFRVINMGAFAAQYVWFEGHTMRVVEVDGVYTEPMEADMIYLTAAQRYSVLVTAKNDTSSNFAFTGSMDQVSPLFLTHKQKLVSLELQSQTWTHVQHEIARYTRKTGSPRLRDSPGAYNDLLDEFIASATDCRCLQSSRAEAFRGTTIQTIRPP